MTIATLVRVRKGVIAVKAEATPGTDSIAGAPGPTDFVAGDLSMTLNPTVVPNNAITGTLDKAPGIVGGEYVNVQIVCQLRGSGTAGTAPDWAKLMKLCTFSQIDTAATVGAPTAAADGTTTGITLADPAGTTAQAYRGMPIILSGDQTAESGIIDYTADQVATLGETLAAAPTEDTEFQIPVNTLWAPTSDEAVYQNGTLYFQADGIRWKIVGAIGTWSLALTAGSTGAITFNLQGQIAGYDTADTPTTWVPSVVQPPVWIGGKSQLGQATARIRQLTINAGVTVGMPENPEAAEGIDAGVPTARAIAGSLDPLTDTVNSAALYNKFRAGTAMPLMARLGSTPGNRFLIILPAIVAQSFAQSPRNDLMQDAINFAANAPDAGAFICGY